VAAGISRRWSERVEVSLFGHEWTDHADEASEDAGCDHLGLLLNGRFGFFRGAMTPQQLRKILRKG
jgi:hypothetical protein